MSLEWTALNYMARETLRKPGGRGWGGCKWCVHCPLKVILSLKYISPLRDICIKPPIPLGSLSSAARNEVTQHGHVQSLKRPALTTLSARLCWFLASAPLTFGAGSVFVLGAVLCRVGF